MTFSRGIEMEHLREMCKGMTFRGPQIPQMKKPTAQHSSMKRFIHCERKY